MANLFTLLLSTGLQYPYQVIHSKRAKYIRIKLTSQGDLSVSIPPRTKMTLAHEFIDSKKEWIEKNLAKIDFNQNHTVPGALDLRLLQECWVINYVAVVQSANESIKVKEVDDLTIEIRGTQDQLDNIILINKVLNQWCRKKAKTIFNSMLQKLAELHGFHYQRLSIRAQKTRWGSCSNKKNINLNCKLLFMPEEVVRYVMIHELCHTIEMNHSSRFWSLVEDCDPNYRQNKQSLKRLGREIVL